MTLRRIWVVATVGAALLASGCGRPPQVSGHNRRLVLSLATAVSAQNPKWLEQNAEMIDAMRAQGKLSASEDVAFTSILSRARSGQWEAARDEAYALRDAQEPLPENVEAVRKRTLPEPKKPALAKKRARYASSPAPPARLKLD